MGERSDGRGAAGSSGRRAVGLDQMVVGGVALVFVAWAVVGGLRGVHRGGGSTVGVLRPASVTQPVTPAESPSLAAPGSVVGQVPGQSSAAAEVTVVSAPSTPAASTGRVVGQPASFRAAFTGDVLPHMPMLKRIIARHGAITFKGALSEVKPMLSAVDLAVCHLEGAMVAPGEPLRTNPRLGVPPAMLDEVSRGGFDRCSTASNHSLDGGVDGVKETVRAFAARGLGQSGMAVSEEQRLPEVFTVNGISVAHLSYTYGFDVGVRPRGERWWSNLIDPALIIEDAQAMRAAGAEAVIVSMHWGNTQWAKVSAEQRAWAETLTASGAIDLIVGHHSHMLQPIEQINGRWVLFGMSNFLSDMPVNDNWAPQTQDGGIFVVTVERSDDGSIVVGRPAVYPTWCDKKNDSTVRFSGPDARADDLPAATGKQLDISYRRVERLYGDFVVDASS